MDTIFSNGIARDDAEFRLIIRWVLNSANTILGNTKTNVVTRLPNSFKESAIIWAEIIFLIFLIACKNRKIILIIIMNYKNILIEGKDYIIGEDGRYILTREYL